MALGTYVKTPEERKRYSIDYYDWLDQDEIIDTVNFSTSPQEPDDYTGFTFVVDAYEIFNNGTEVIFYVFGGIDGWQYLVDVEIITAGGQVKQDQVLFQIRELQELVVAETAMVG